MSLVDRSVLFTALICIAACAQIGCGSAPAAFGKAARFSPAYQGYVMAPANGSDDPGVDETVLLLRDPLTGNKLRCQEDVKEWRELHEDIAVDRVHDDNVALAVGISTGAFFGPLIAMAPVGGLLMAEALLVTQELYDAFRADNATEMLATGIALHNRKRFAQSTMVIERALAKDGAVGLFDKAYYYLGLNYLELGKQDRAKLALNMFIERSAVRDVDAYRKAEAELSKLGEARRACESTEPIELYW